MQLFSYFVYIQKDCMHSDNWAVFCQLTQCLLIQLQLPILTQFSQRKGEKPKESRECRGGCGKLSAYSCTSGCCAGCCPGHCSRHSGPPNPVPVAPPTSQSVTYSATAARMMAAMGYQVLQY